MRKNLKKLFSYYKPYMGIFIADMFFAFGAAAVSLVIPLVVRYITSEVVHWESSQALHTILRLGVIMLVLIAVQCYCNYFISNYGHVMGAKIEYDMRAEIFSHYQKLSFRFYDDQKVGQLMSRITSDLFDITELLHHGPENIVISLIRIIGAFIIMVNISPRLTVAAFALVPFMLVYAYVFNKKMKRAFRMNRVKIADINSQIEDNLSGIRVVKSFANEEIENKKFKKGNDGFLDAKKNSYRYMGGYNAGLTAFTTAITVVVMLSGGVMIARGKGNITDLITFLLYINVFTEPIKTLIDFTEQFQNGYSGFERFMEMISVVPDIKDAPDAQPMQEVKGEISFENVSFHYADSDQMVLNHVNLEVPAGEYVALVGSSGAGKSTLVNLACRFFEPTKGRILIDGRDYRERSQLWLHSNIGYVLQNPHLFSGTVMENIRYGRLDATDEEVKAAARAVHADEVAEKLDKGYDSDVGEGGDCLSTGEKQLLSFARAVLADPAIFVLDEATSSIDTKTEQLIQQATDKLLKGRTSFLIAHRLSTIRNADLILVVRDGKIVEQGKHKELLAKKGYYYQLVRQQFADEESRKVLS